MELKILRDQENNTSLPRVKDDQLDFDENLIYYLNGRRFTGIGYEEIPGRELSEITYRDGMQDGPARDWYPSGRLKSESIYHRNVLHGHDREFWEDGSLASEKHYEHGVLVRSTEFDENGHPVSTFEISEDDPSYDILQKIRRSAGS
jgi:antitoxin component YwqK of YwqJK toxin-antitoxin module